MDDFDAALARAASATGQALDMLLPAARDPESRLFDAMRYAAMGGGKRLRPFLVLNSAALFDVNTDCALRVAAAVECVHSYSLAHDDLPCMDDDDLRRGKPSTHRQFDEATAVLAGDGLLSLAFEILAGVETHEDPNVRCELVRGLAVASGPHGMVGGQMLDLQAEHETLSAPAITRLQQLKTGALIAFASEAGAILGRASPSCRHALHAYAHDFGLAFQITDDLLDIESNDETLGKSAGKDQAAGKSTLVSLLGVDRARLQAKILSEQAVKHLDLFDEKADLLRAAALYAIDRRA
ncbi:MAG: polyprenyl synthetase family protein [Alphaproteobacteria bacterium]|nr:polyprenyl synthetase family protein [Alphaproteobacteria bacterium]